MKLYMVLLGCLPKGRYTEQHDIFFGIGNSLKELVPEMINWWPEAEGDIHIDAWREVKNVDGYKITITERQSNKALQEDKLNKLFFINLGGYRQNEFEEFHYKMLVACENKSAAIQKAKTTAFYKHTGFKNAPSHIDDKYGIDVDDIYQIEDIISKHIKDKYSIVLCAEDPAEEDEIHLGYLIFQKLE